MFRDSLVGLLSEFVQVKGHITLKIMFGLDENMKAIIVKYLVVDVPSSNNIIERPAIILLGDSLSTLYLRIKDLIYNGSI